MWLYPQYLDLGWTILKISGAWIQTFGLGHNWNRSRCKVGVLPHKSWELSNCFDTMGSIERNCFHTANSYLTHRKKYCSHLSWNPNNIFPSQRILISLSLCCRSSFSFFNSSFPAALLVSFSSEMCCETVFLSEIFEWFISCYQKKQTNKRYAPVTLPPAMYLFYSVTV